MIPQSAPPVKEKRARAPLDIYLNKYIQGVPYMAKAADISPEGLSLAHLIGTPRYDRSSSARDSAVTALVTFGEGYHSYHHRFPFDFRNGVRWWHYDPSKWLIVSLSRVGLTSRLHRASAAAIDAASRSPRRRSRGPVRTEAAGTLSTRRVCH